MSSMSRSLPYGSRGDVESDDSHACACTCIHPCTCFGTYLSIVDVGGWNVTLRHHAMPRLALHRLFVVAVVVVTAAR
jgi:hypothetical protein